MKIFYPARLWMLTLFMLMAILSAAQTPTVVTAGTCSGVVANFNSNDNGFNSPSIYGSIFDSSLYYHSGRGYWTDYLPPYRVTAPGFPRVLNIISPPYNNPNPIGSFNVGFYYIVSNPAVDRFQVRIISVTQTAMGTVTNVEATSGVQFFSDWSDPTVYADGVTTPVPDPTPLMTGFQGYVCIKLTDPDITNGENVTYRVEVSYLMSAPLFAVFDNLSIGPLGSPLPVNFIGLVANRENNNAELKWDVTDEVNVREYVVERSVNGSNFTMVGEVPAKGKSIYTYTNYNIPATTVFYRVRSIDQDGRSKYSGILRLKGSTSYGEGVKVYPVPANDEITIEHGKLQRGASIIITTLDGKSLRTINPVDGASHTPVNISSMSRGMYFLRIDDGTGDVQTVKLIKN